jgi:Ca2+-transporting ATPase
VVLSWLDVSADTGLDRQEARARLIAYGRNRLRDAKTRSSGEILLSQFRSPIVYLLMVAAMLALMFGELPETVAIVSILVINSTIGFLTESRAARSMEALRNLTTREALARRSGEVLTVDAEELVPGDIVVLDAGDIPSADMRIISSSNLSCDESALTGESMPVAKSVDPVAADTALADRSCMLYRGSPMTVFGPKRTLSISAARHNVPE